MTKAKRSASATSTFAALKAEIEAEVMNSAQKQLDDFVKNELKIIYQKLNPKGPGSLKEKQDKLLAIIKDMEDLYDAGKLDSVEQNKIVQRVNAIY